jgi:Na+/H+ antiporter NhaD/arsenite permease-like protein
LTAALIFLLTYVVLAVGRFPGLRIDRTGAAIIGASAMVAANVLSLDEAYRAINLDTIILLFGMMIVVANLQLSGFFALISERVVEHAHRRLALLAAIVVVAGLFSAFFVNDTMCLVLTPLVLEITSAMRAKPVPYLLGIAMGANIGSAATITGNPQNMLIGAYSGIDYRVFAGHLAPVAAAGLLITILLLYVAYRSEFRSHSTVRIERLPVRVDRLLLWKSVTVAAGMILFFFAGWPTPKVAIVAGALLLITRRIEPEEIYRRIDWGLLVMFAGLFIVVAGFEKSPFEHDLKDFASRLHFGNVFVLSAVSAVLSNIVSNVPAVLVFKPLMAQIADPLHAWLTLAMSSTFAGNLTVLGSVANLIVIEQARGEVEIGFWEYLRVGAPLAIVTILIGAFWLANT